MTCFPLFFIYFFFVYQTVCPFQFNLPSGAHVVADIKSHGLHVYIHVTSEDYAKTSGLCGTYDGNPGNDPYSARSLSDINKFRIKQRQSLFDKKPEKTVKDRIPVDFCTCSDEDTISCGSEELVDPGSYTGVPGITDVGPPGSVIEVPRRRTRRDTSEQDDEDPDTAYEEGDSWIEWSYKYDYGDRYVAPPVTTTWPTPRSKDEARTKCEASLRKLPFYEKCKNNVGIDEEEVLMKCLKAIQRTGDLDIAPLSLSSFEHQCFFDASSQEKLRTRNSDGTMGLPDGSLFLDMCPENCNGHGTCSRQRCNCNPGFRASDCHLPEDQRPTIHALIGGETCDVRERPCRHLSILVSNVTDESTLTCRITFVDANDISGLVYDTKATLRSWTEVVCELPDSPLVANDNNDGDSGNHVIDARHYWSIEISNDGKRYSGGVKLMVWDSKCLSCRDDNQCAMKPNTCLIENRCYGRYDSYSGMAFCSRCDPSVSTSLSTPIPNNKPPVLRGPFTVYKLRDEEYSAYLVAADPDSDSDLRFSLDRPSGAVASGVALTSRGLLRVFGELRDDVTIKVKVTDNCGASESAAFRIRTMNCTCATTTSCSDAYSSPSRAHQYACACDGACTASSVEACLLPICSESVRCEPSGYRSGYDCQCRTPSRQTRCSADRSSFWSVWSPWSTCSKPCDYGVRTRQRACLLCPEPEVSTELCNRENCPELPDEQHTGLFVVVQVTNVMKTEEMLKKQDVFLDIVRQFINKLCAKDPSACCRKDVWLNPLVSHTFVSRNDIWLARGYPTVNWDERLIDLKILAAIERSVYEEYCLARSRRHKRAAPSDVHYVPPEVVKRALTENVGLLEERLHLTVTDVYEADTEDAEDGLLLVAVGVGLSVLVIVIVVIVTIIVKKRKQNESRRRKQERLEKTEVPPIRDQPKQQAIHDTTNETSHHYEQLDNSY